MAEADEIGDYGLVMPFVVCQSQGGPFDDDAYVAGYEMGLLDAHLRHWEPEDLLAQGYLDQTMRAENQPQIDLIAMKHGFTAQFDDAGDGWTYVTLRRPE